MLYNIISSGLDVLLCLCVCVCMHACVIAVSMAEFHKAFHSCLSLLFSPLATPPCITALRLLRFLFLSFLIDMQQPTSLNCVFYAPWFSALSSSLMFPFLGWLNDVSICQRSLFIHAHVTVLAYKIACITCAVHECMNECLCKSLPYFYP